MQAWTNSENKHINNLQYISGKTVYFDYFDLLRRIHKLQAPDLGVMGHQIEPIKQFLISTMTGVTKAVVCDILSVG